MPALTKTDVENFREAVNSLTKWRRADLKDENDNPLIDELYEDPYQDQHLFREFKRANTAFLIGRKGTGKSTIFQKVQSELRKDNKVLTAYLDVNSIHQNVDLEHIEFDSHGQSKFGQKLTWFQGFLEIFLNELIKEISEKAGTNLFMSMFTRKPNKTQAIKDIQNLFDVNNYIVPTNVAPTNHGTSGTKITKSKDTGTSINGGFSGKKISVGAGAKYSSGTKVELANETIDNSVIRIFQISKFIHDLRKALDGLKIKHVYIFVDDYSDLPAAAMKFLMDNVIAPLENASNEYIKFKIAAYPNKFYMTGLDPQKINFFYLDISLVYKTTSTTEMDNLATDYTGRLLSRRLNFYCKKGLDHFFAFEASSVLELLYQTAFCNPRALGWILDYCAEDKLSRLEKITSDAIKLAARRYYEERVEQQLLSAKFIENTDKEKAEITIASALNEAICLRSRELRNYKDSDFFKSFGTRQNPTSHFYCTSDCDETIFPLVQFQFVNHYRDARDKSGAKISIYALNYGLCEKEKIPYGKPSKANEYKDYFVQRVFDYSDIIRNAKSDVEIFECDSCSAQQPTSDESSFRRYNYKCPDCEDGILIRKHFIPEEHKPGRSKAQAKLSKTEYEILAAINTPKAKGNIYARHIVEMVDISPSLAGQIARKLAELGYIERTKVGNTYHYKITKIARDTFFASR